MCVRVLNKYGRVRGGVPSGASHDSHTGGDEENKGSLRVIAKFVEAPLSVLML